MSRVLRPRPVLTTPTQRWIFDGTLGLAMLGMLFSIYNPALLLTTTTATGGDTGAHVYAAWWARDQLLPRGLLSGWSPGWLGGVPMFHFYFPLGVFFIALMSYVVPFEVAFKLGTSSGPFLFVASAYVLFRLLRFDFPAPIFAALLAAAFLFMDSFTIYGGNLASTLAGEFSFSLGFGLSLIFTGLLYRLVTDSSARPLLSAVVLAATVLTHLVPVMMILLVSPAFIFWGIKILGWRRALSRLAVVFGVGAALTAVWAIPFVVRAPLTTSFGTTPLRGLGIAFPMQLWIYVAATLLACGLAVTRRDRRLLVVLLPGLVGLALYFVGLRGLVWNGRWLPFWYLSAFLCTAYLIGAVVPLVARRLSRRRAAVATIALSVAIAGIAGAWIVWKRNESFVRHWATHNLNGYERATGWSTFDALHRILNELPPGRVLAEDADRVAEFGTTFAFMSLPYFTHQSTLEGLFFESSVTTPFLIMLQAEISEQPSYSMPDLPYQEFDLLRGARHMRALGVDYLIAASDLTKTAARETGEFNEVGQAGGYSVFALGTPQLVSIPEFRPVVVRDDWERERIEWWTGLDSSTVPVAPEGPEDWTRVEDVGDDVPRLRLDHGGDSFDALIEGDEISFTTDAVGEPHVVEVSYFPNWRVEGALGPYRIAPSLMAVVPTQADVRLHYERTWAEWLGVSLTLLAIAALALTPTRRAIARWGGA